MSTNCFQHYLVDKLKEYKENIAIRYGDAILSFGAIDSLSDRIFKGIMTKEFEKETFIGIFLNDIPDVILSMIGILKARCVFVPFHKDLPDEKIIEMASAINLKHIICNRQSIGKLENIFENGANEVNTICYEDLIEDNKALNDYPWKEIPYNKEDKIYIYFTSGTSGKPKVIVGRNKSLLHFIKWELSAFEFKQKLNFSQFITPIFDAFLRDVFVALCSGGTLCIPENDKLVFDADNLLNWIEKYKIYLIHCVPSVFKIINTDNINKNNLRFLRYILLSGEPIYPSILKNWFDKMGDSVSLVNLYGTTETTMIKSFYVIKQGDESKERIPIGKPIDNCQLLICDDKFNLCESLVPGEIYIRTPFMTHGYYNNKKENDKVFLKNPFSKVPNDLLYKTGDYGRILLDGNFEILGRKDRQVKIRGIRVELEELENEIHKNKNCQEVVVQLKYLNSKQEHLIAYIVRTVKSKINSIDLKNELLETMQVHLIPNDILLLESIPKKPNGKIDYDKLPLPKLNQEIVEPKNDTERKLIKIWTKILEKNNINVNANFLEIGGNSLNSISVLSRIYNEFGIKVSLKDFYICNTIRKLASIINSSSNKINTIIKQAEKKEYYELSPTQKGLYIMQSLNSTSTSYNIFQAYQIKGFLDVEKLNLYFKLIIDRHEAFRTSFHIVNGKPVQKIADMVDFNIEVFKCGKRSIGNSIVDFRNVFQLEMAPLIRVGVIRLNKYENILMVDIHHLVSDGTSVTILGKELENLFNLKPLNSLKYTYKDFAYWRQMQSNSSITKKKEEYWRKLFNNKLIQQEIPKDYQISKSKKGEKVSIMLEDKVIKSLRAISEENKVSMCNMFSAIFSIFLSRICNTNEIIIGLPAWGRKVKEFESIIGVFIDMLPVKCTIDSSKTLVDLLNEIKDNSIEAVDNSDYPYEKLAKVMFDSRNIKYTNLYQVSLSYRNYYSENLNFPEFTLKPLFVDETDAKFELCLIVNEFDKNISVTLEYMTGFYKRETINLFIKSIQQIANNISQNPNLLLKNIVVSNERYQSMQVEDLYNE